MNKKINLLAILMLFGSIFLTSCKKEEEEKVAEKNGHLSIWTDRSDLLPMAVYVDDAYIGSITSEFEDGQPLCGDAKTISIYTIKGTHSYSVLHSDTTVAKGTIEVGANCNLLKLQ